MNELQRTEYLTQMGIEVFVPRFVLPAAKVSALATLPEAATAEVLESDRSPGEPNVPANDAAPEGGKLITEPSPENVAGIVSGIMGELGGLTSQRANAKEAKESTQIHHKAPSDSPLAEESVRFTLNIWQVSSSLMVIDSHQPMQALPTAALLSNIMFAKGVHARLPAPESLSWPLFENSVSGGGWQEASSMVQAFLGERLATRPSRYLWLLGEHAYNSIYPTARDFDKKLGLAVDLPEFSCLAIVLPSLKEMLSRPELKPEFWRAIRPYDIK